jgi:hypothetical protein
LSLGRGLCIVTILFASGDLWPTLTIGFTFRFSQLCILLALLVLFATGPERRIRGFPGAPWLYGFVLWVFACLPLSLYLDRSVGYALWLLEDVLIVFVFVQYFDTERALLDLLRWFLISFVVLSAFGLLQFALGLVGVSLFVAEWWIDGRLPRVNGLSYEPSYYASYVLCGWVLSLYLLEKRAPVPGRRLQWICALATTLGLTVSSSRLGWGLMIAWLFTRGSLFLARTFLRGALTRRALRRTLALAVAGLVVVAIALNHIDALSARFETVSFLIAGLGVLGQSAHSSEQRFSAFTMTWEAFLHHPLIGTGIGAVPAEVAAQQGTVLASLEDAKQNEGLSVLAELAASTGVIGVLLVSMFIAALSWTFQRVRNRLELWRLRALAGLSWSMAWLMLALQFNQNFLRVYLFVHLGVLVCCLTAGRQSPAPRSDALPHAV